MASEVLEKSVGGAHGEAPQGELAPFLPSRSLLFLAVCLKHYQELPQSSCEHVSEEHLTGLPGLDKAYHWPAFTWGENELI